ncbi:hypothetical protein Vafri_9046, partial [Volvox africanus]
GVPPMLYSDLVALGFCIYHFWVLHESMEVKMKKPSGRATLAGRTTPATSAVTFPAKNVLSSVAMFCRVAHEVVATPLTQSRVLSAPFAGKSIRWKTQDEAVDRILMMTCVMVIGRTLARACHRLSSDDGQRRVMEVLRKVGLEEMERVQKDSVLVEHSRTDLSSSGGGDGDGGGDGRRDHRRRQLPAGSSNSRYGSQQLREDPVHFRIQLMISKFLASLPILVQYVW